MKVIVIGAGASGTICAMKLKEEDIDVVVLERNEKIMKKIYATGNGRCNFTNRTVESKNYHGENPKFVLSAIHSFSNNDTIQLFKQMGIKECELQNGKIYPLSLQSSSIPKQMESYLKYLNVPIKFNQFVERIEKKDRQFLVVTNRSSFYADIVVLCTGGKAYQKSGSDGNGYNLAKMLGHHITDLHPGIVQLRLKGDTYKVMSGTKFIGKLYVVINNKKYQEQYDDILFTDYGISGPTVLQVSGEVIRKLRKGKQVFLSLDLIPSMDENTLYNHLCMIFKMNSYKSLAQSLIGLLNDHLIGGVIQAVNLSSNLSVSSLKKEEILKLAKCVKDFRFEVTGYKSDQDGQVTCGGVKTKEIHPNTLESKLVEGLYFTGELIDIDGDCGGYNLQWAWSSGMHCAQSIIRKEETLCLK